MIITITRGEPDGPLQGNPIKQVFALKGQSPVTEEGITLWVKIILALMILLLLFLFFPTILYGASEWIGKLITGR